MEAEVIIYPSYYDAHSSLLDEIEEMIAERQLVYYASSLIHRGVEEGELEAAIKKACNAVRSAELEVHHHFKKVFVSCEGGICYDWHVSDLGMRLTIAVLSAK